MLISVQQALCTVIANECNNKLMISNQTTSLLVHHTSHQLIFRTLRHLRNALYNQTVRKICELGKNHFAAKIRLSNTNFSVSCLLFTSNNISLYLSQSHAFMIDTTLHRRYQTVQRCHGLCHKCATVHALGPKAELVSQGNDGREDRETESTGRNVGLHPSARTHHHPCTAGVVSVPRKMLTTVDTPALPFSM